MRHRRGNIALTVALSLVAVLGFGALVVDIGWMQYAGQQLQIGVDAAAVAGASGLRTDVDTVVARASGLAAYHTAGGSPVAVSAADVEIGTWDAEHDHFVALAPGEIASADAVRVTGTVADLSAFLSPVLGVTGLSVTRSAVAGIREVGPVQCVILADDIAIVTGSVEIDAYSSAEGSYALTRSENAGVCSNGDLSLGGSSELYGSAWAGPDGELDQGGSALVTGRTDHLEEPLPMPEVDCAAAKARNENASIASYLSGYNFKAGSKDELTLYEGVYYVHDLTVSAGAQITIDGDVTICAESGKVQLNGDALINTSKDPSTFTLSVADDSAVTLNGTSTFYGSVLAPKSTQVKLNGTFDYYGILVASEVTLLGNFDFHGDLSLAEESVAPVMVRVGLLR